MEQLNLLHQSKLPNGKFYIPRFEKVDWKQIASLDVDKLRETCDWSLLQRNLKNVIYCNVDLEFPGADPNLRKLFQLAQVAVELFSSVQNAAAVRTEEVEKQLLRSQAELEATVKDKRELEKKIKELKKEKKNTDHNEINRTNACFKCPYCPKAFLNSDFLKSHLQRRHGEIPVLNSTLGLPSYPLLHQLIPSAPPVQQFSPVPTAPPISPPAPEKVLDESLIFKEQVEVLKQQLQNTEECLQNERNIFARLLEKYETSNVALQSTVQGEIQKIHEKLVTQAEQPVSKSSNVSKRLYSIAVQTEEVKTVKVESFTQSVLEEPSEEPPMEIKQERAAHAEPCIPSQESVEETIPAVDKASPALRKKPTKKVKEKRAFEPNRHVPEPFQAPEMEQSKLQVRKLVHRALTDKMEELGLSQKDAEVPDSKFSRVMKKLKRERTNMGAKFKPYETLRAKFEQQISARLKTGNQSPAKTSCDVTKPKAKKKLFGQYCSQSKERDTPAAVMLKSPEKVAVEANVYEESPVRKIIAGKSEPKLAEDSVADSKSNPVMRGPVPIPRSKPAKIDDFEEKPLFMARDGEATGALDSSVKFLAKNLESSSSNRTVKPPTNSVDLIPKIAEKSLQLEDSSDNSFSLSSLDNILASLKKPTKTSTPKINRSVSWKDPLDSRARSTGYESWDSN